MEIDQNPQSGVTLKAISASKRCSAGSGLGHDVVIPPMPGTKQWGHKARTYWIGRHMPGWFRQMRQIAMFDVWSWGRKELKCPACLSSPGWLDVQTLVVCPICGGFVDLPELLAIWYLQHDAILIGEANRRRALAARVDRERPHLVIRQRAQHMRLTTAGRELV